MPREKLQVGSVVADRFRLVEFLGEGSVGEVFLGEHQVLGRSFAIKLLKEQFRTDAKLMERFRREALVASRLDHPNIVYISDFGGTADGRFYLAMEYIDGSSLTDLIEDLQPNVPSLRRALHILQQVASALGAAHDAGIVHRDLKPENIMLRSIGPEEDEVKILDFGMAKIMAYTGAHKLTGVGEIFGTPMFMSPEQARGEKVDHRTDLYSFGVLAFELFTGRAPFECKTLEALIVANQKEVPPPPSQVRPLTAVPLPPTLDQLVVQCLEKDRDRRPKDMATIMGVLELSLKRAGRPTRPYSTASTPVVDESMAATIDTTVEEQAAANEGGLDRTMLSALDDAGVERLAHEDPWQWRRVCKCALKLGEWLIEAGVADDELKPLVAGLQEQAQRVDDAQKALAFPAESLRELEQQHRERTARLRHAVIDLSLERSSKAEVAGTDPSVLEDLDFQIRSLEERLAHEHSTGTNEAAGVRQEVRALEQNLEALLTARTAQELQLVLLLRARRPDSPSPEQSAAYLELEQKLRGG